jgi:hypothetical protein
MYCTVGKMRNKDSAVTMETRTCSLLSIKNEVKGIGGLRNKLSMEINKNNLLKLGK